MPKTLFQSTKQTESERIVQTAIATSIGFYTSKDFYILPRLIDKNNKCVHLPDLDYSKIHNFWERVKKYDNVLPVQNIELISEVESILEFTSPEIKRVHLESKWKSIEKEFWAFLYTLIPEAKNLVKAVDVRVTDYGTSSSFTCLKNNTPSEILCYIRSDFSVAEIAEAIISSIIYNYSDTIFYSWESKESFVDFVLSKSSIASLFPDFKPTLNALKIDSEELLNESNDYLQSFNLHFEKELQVRDENIFLNGKNINDRISRQEDLILKELIAANGELVNIYDLGDAIWTESDDFSLQALNKSIQRLRNKLHSLGATQNCIKTIRGRGYVI